MNISKPEKSVINISIVMSSSIGKNKNAKQINIPFCSENFRNIQCVVLCALLLRSASRLNASSITCLRSPPLNSVTTRGVLL